MRMRALLDRLPWRRQDQSLGLQYQQDLVPQPPRSYQYVRALLLGDKPSRCGGLQRWVRGVWIHSRHGQLAWTLLQASMH